MDPASPFVWCQYVDPEKNKKCSIPVLKVKSVPFCKYHEEKGPLDQKVSPAKKSKKASGQEKEGRVKRAYRRRNTQQQQQKQQASPQPNKTVPKEEAVQKPAVILSSEEGKYDTINTYSFPMQNHTRS